MRHQVRLVFLEVDSELLSDLREVLNELGTLREQHLNGNMLTVVISTKHSTKTIETFLADEHPEMIFGVEKISEEKCHDCCVA